jgi:hypothetical protein
MSTAYIGIDPGAEGAIAVLWPSGASDGSVGEIAFFDMNGSDHDLIDFLRDQKIRASVYGHQIAAVLENVNSFGMGRQSAFKFGGAWRGVRVALIALGIPLIAEPTAAQWKLRIFGSTIKGFDKKALKTASRDKARQLFPWAARDLARVKDADRAEALLLAEYGRMIRRTLSGEKRHPVKSLGRFDAIEVASDALLVYARDKRMKRWVKHEHEVFGHWEALP